MTNNLDLETKEHVIQATTPKPHNVFLAGLKVGDILKLEVNLCLAEFSSLLKNKHPRTVAA